MAPRPSPLMARPRMKRYELGAKVHRREPASKMARPVMKTVLSGKMV